MKTTGEITAVNTLIIRILAETVIVSFYFHLWAVIQPHDQSGFVVT